MSCISDNQQFVTTELTTNELLLLIRLSEKINALKVPRAHLAELRKENEWISMAGMNIEVRVTELKAMFNAADTSLRLQAAAFGVSFP